MKCSLETVDLKRVVMTSAGAGIFLGNSLKTFVIYVDTLMGEQIKTALEDEMQVRPLTFDFIRYIILSFSIQVRSITIYNEADGVFFARVIFMQEKDKKYNLLEVDVRPSDAILLALTMKKQIFVDPCLFNRLPDAEDLLNNLSKLDS